MDVISSALGGLPLWSLALILPMVFLAGFVDAIGGGGGLISLPAYMIAGLPPHLAIGTNKLSSSMGTAVATLKYARNGYMVWSLCAVGIVAAVIGSSAGAHAMLGVSDTVLNIFMLIALPVIAFYVFKKKDLVSKGAPFSRAATAVLVAVIACAVGFYDGFYGPGTGTFLILLLTGLARIDVFKAAGITKAINLTTNIAALVVFLLNANVLVPLGLLAGVFNIGGNYLGATMFQNRGSQIVRPIILVVLVVFAVHLIAQLAGVA